MFSYEVLKHIKIFVLNDYEIRMKFDLDSETLLNSHIWNELVIGYDIETETFSIKQYLLRYVSYIANEVYHLTIYLYQD